MPNNDYILRSDALKLICTVCQHLCDDSDEFGNGICSIFTSLECCPAADVEPKRKTGYWFDLHASQWVQYGAVKYKCSECGNDVMRKTKYCEECGAKMDGKPSEGENNV